MFGESFIRSSVNRPAGHLWPWSTDAVISSTGIFVAITNNTLYGSKLYIFILCQKSLDIKIMFHEDILYISYRDYIKT